MKNNQTPKVYVGTYKKYNSGSIAGAWIDLAKCATYSNFINKCKEVHKDEMQPELMIQDYECFPDGLGCMEWLSEEDFNDILSAFNSESEAAESSHKFQVIDYSERAIALVGDTASIKEQLKQLGGRFNPRLSCGAGWVFPKTKSADVQSLIGNAEAVQTHGKTKVAENPFKAILEEFLNSRKLPSDKTYYGKYNVGAVRANGGYILIEKPYIENKFCFSNEGAGYTAYKEITKTEKKLERYFLAENLRQVDDKIKDLKTERRLFVTRSMDGRVSWNGGRYGEKWNETDIEMSQELREELIKAYEVSRAMFEKRLHTYLKRYGTSKLRTWTYWADA